MKRKKNLIFAAIDIGANSIKMELAEVNSNGEINILEELKKNTQIGHDTFSFGKIKFESIHELCETLNGFKKIIKEYKVRYTKVVATSSIREAENRQYVIEQIKLFTGFKIEIINSSQERYYIYCGLRDYINQFTENGNSIVLHIGSGGVEISVFNKGKLLFADYIRIGALRLKEILAALERKTMNFPGIIEEFIESRIRFLKIELNNLNITNFIGLGGETRTILNTIASNNMWISKDELVNFKKSIMKMTTEQISQEFNIPINDTQILLPAVIIFDKIINMTNADKIHSPMISIRHGLIISLVDRLYNKKDFVEMEEEIITSVWNLAKTFNIDESHAKQVMVLSLSIFNQTKKIHKMGKEEKLYIVLASILHDIGKSTSPSQHDLHAYNIIKYQDILGMSTREANIIANVARYHSEEIPNFLHENYKQLSEKDKIVVSKLSAILKLSEALDTTKKQKIKQIIVMRSEEKLLFKVKSKMNILLEEWSFNNQNEYFMEVIGYEPILIHEGDRNG